MTKKALITGVEGFIGRHTAVALADRGFEIHGHDVKSGVDSRDVLRECDTRYDLVVHCAAHVGGRADIDGRPTYVAAVNTQLDGALFEYVLRTRPAHVIYWSSSAAYPVCLQAASLRPHKLVESFIDLDDPKLPDASYGAVKIVGENMARWARREGVNVHVFRPFSGYGEDQDRTYPFPRFIQRARQRDDPFEIWGDGRQMRDFVHVKDVVRCALAAVDQDYPDPLNICNGRATSFNELARLVCAEANHRPSYRRLVSAPTGVFHRVGDPTEMLKVYRPKITLEEGIKRALA